MQRKYTDNRDKRLKEIVALRHMEKYINQLAQAAANNQDTINALTETNVNLQQQVQLLYIALCRHMPEMLKAAVLSHREDFLFIQQITCQIHVIISLPDAVYNTGPIACQ